MSLRVVHGGVLSLLQDTGRRGYGRHGLTGGGPVDAAAYHFCNRLLGNAQGATVVETSVGGAAFEVTADTCLCVTGAEAVVTINDEPAPMWQGFPVRAGDIVALGHARRGCRLYLGIAGGFTIAASFGSTATVVRERVGGLDGGALQAGDLLPAQTLPRPPLLRLPRTRQPRYGNRATVRVIPCYQHRVFSRRDKRRFFSAAYTVSEQSDRMGYRLEGPAIDSPANAFLSEGIVHGAIQIPGDGQPIVLLNDCQTIGGYPKIGTALSLDLWRLGQLTAGALVHFTPVTRHTARRALLLAHRFHLNQPLETVG